MNTVNKFLVQLKEKGIPVEAAYLFGSYARGREKEWSDIDVAVISSTNSYDRLKKGFVLPKFLLLSIPG
jgi:predicted nucleotidyltransferase